MSLSSCSNQPAFPRQLESTAADYYNIIMYARCASNKILSELKLDKSGKASDGRHHTEQQFAASASPAILIHFFYVIHETYVPSSESIYVTACQFRFITSQAQSLCFLMGISIFTVSTAPLPSSQSLGNMFHSLRDIFVPFFPAKEIHMGLRIALLGEKWQLFLWDTTWKYEIFTTYHRVG